MDNEYYEQLDIFSLMKNEKEEEQSKYPRLKVGDKIGKLVLGEVKIATITEVEGNENSWFYRTDRGTCYDMSDRTDFEQMEKEAEEIRKQHKTIEIKPHELDKFFSVKYPPRWCDGHILYAMVAIYKDMLFWEEDVTYQFLEKPKNLEKAYKEKVKSITHLYSFDKNEREYEVLDEPIPIRRLYYSKSRDLFADAEYVLNNP